MKTVLIYNIFLLATSHHYLLLSRITLSVKKFKNFLLFLKHKIETFSQLSQTNALGKLPDINFGGLGQK